MLRTQLCRNGNLGYPLKESGLGTRVYHGYVPGWNGLHLVHEECFDRSWQSYAKRKGQMMSDLKYEEIGPVSHDEAEINLISGNPELMARTLIALGLYDDDWKWVQTLGLKFLRHESEVVVSAAVLALAHTARVNGDIDKDLVLPALRAVAVDNRYTGWVQDALDDIEMFVRT